MKKIFTMAMFALVLTIGTIGMTRAADEPECACGTDPDTGICIPCPEPE